MYSTYTAYSRKLDQAVQYKCRLFKEARSRSTVHIQTIQDRTGQQAKEIIVSFPTLDGFL